MNMRSVRLASLAALSVCVSVQFAASSRADNTEASYVQGEILVGYAPTMTDYRRAMGVVQDVGVVAAFEPRLRAARVKLRPGVSVQTALARLNARPGVAYAEPNHLVRICATPNDPAFPTKQYAPQKIQADDSWDIWKPREKVVVAVVDTGIEGTHPDLTAILYRNAAGAVIGWNTLNNSAAWSDDAGHGTHAAGVAAARINDARGPAGVAGWNPNVANSDTYVKLMPVKALSSTGIGTDASVSAGIIWAADNGARVINTSFSSSNNSSTMANAVAYAWSKGCVIVAAAGNNNSSALTYPAALPNVISVAATDRYDKLMSYSQYGSWIRCAAPGSDIYSTYRNGSYSGLSGTSVATPHVSGEAAAILAQNPTLTNQQVVDLICQHVDPVSPYLDHSLSPDAGRINLYRALKAAGDGTASLTMVSFDPPAMANQTSAVGTVQIGAPAPAGGMVVSLTSLDTSVVTVPASVTIPAGAISANFTATGKYVHTNSTATIKATADGKQVTGDVTVIAAVPATFTVNPTIVPSSSAFTGTVTLDSPAPSTGAKITLTNNGAGLVSTPATFTIPAGSKTGTFTGSTGATSRNVSVTITAAHNGKSLSASVRVTTGTSSAALSSLTLNPASVLGGEGSTGTVSLTAAAPSGGFVVSLTTSSATLAKVPSTVTVLAGETSASFQITTAKVSAAKSVTVSATAGGTSKSATLKLTTALQSLVASPTGVFGGVSSKGTVTLAKAAPAGGAVVTLASNNAAASVPASVTVAEGATSATFTIQTEPVTTNTGVTISATYSGAKATAKVTVKAPLIAKVTLLPTSVIGGLASVGTVTLSGIAPAGGKTVTLSSSLGSADVPASVVVPAGQKTATFTVTTTAVSLSVKATISGVTGTTTRSAVLTINP